MWDRFLETRLAYFLQWILIIAWMIFAGWLEFGLGVCLTPGFYCAASSGF